MNMLFILMMYMMMLIRLGKSQFTEHNLFKHFSLILLMLMMISIRPSRWFK